MSLTRTRAEFITEVLDQLGVTQIGQTLAAEDVNKIDSRLDNVLEQIRATGIYTVGDPGQMGPTGGNYDAGAVPALGAIVANLCAGSFGLGGDQSLDLLAKRGEKTLYTIQSPARARKFLRTDDALRGVRVWPGRGNYVNGS